MPKQFHPFLSKKASETCRVPRRFLTNRVVEPCRSQSVAAKTLRMILAVQHRLALHADEKCIVERPRSWRVFCATTNRIARTVWPDKVDVHLLSVNVTLWYRTYSFLSFLSCREATRQGNGDGRTSRRDQSLQQCSLSSSRSIAVCPTRRR